MTATPPCSPHTRRNQENLSPKQLTGQDDRSAIVEQRQPLLDRKQRSTHNQAEARIEVLLGNLAQFGGFALTSARKQDVDLAFFPLDPYRRGGRGRRDWTRRRARRSRSGQSV